MPPAGTVPGTQVWPVANLKSDGLAPPIDAPVIVSAALPVLRRSVPCSTGAALVLMLPNASTELASAAAGVGVVTPLPVSVIVCGEPATLEVIETEPLRVPDAVGENVTLIEQLAPAASVPTQLLVDANSGFGVELTCVIVSAAMPELVNVTCCAALVVPIVCVLNVNEVALRVKSGVGVAEPRPVRLMLGLVGALDCTTKDAVRLPVAVGRNDPVSVQFAPGATLTGDALTQVPPAVNSVAFVPDFAIAVIVSVPVPEFVSVIVAGVEVVFVPPTCVEPKVIAAADAVTAAPEAAAGLPM